MFNFCILFHTFRERLLTLSGGLTQSAFKFLIALIGVGMVVAYIGLILSPIWTLPTPVITLSFRVFVATCLFALALGLLAWVTTLFITFLNKLIGE